MKLVEPGSTSSWTLVNDGSPASGIASIWTGSGPMGWSRVKVGESFRHARHEKPQGQHRTGPPGHSVPLWPRQRRMGRGSPESGLPGWGRWPWRRHRCLPTGCPDKVAYLSGRNHPRRRIRRQLLAKREPVPRFVGQCGRQVNVYLGPNRRACGNRDADRRAGQRLTAKVHCSASITGSRWGGPPASWRGKRA